MTSHTEKDVAEIASIAGKLTKAAREEIAHHAEEWKRPVSYNRARRLWLGLKPLGCRVLFLLQKRHGVTEYRLTPLGLAVRNHLISTPNMPKGDD
ncbi:MAG TPA: hypothetical protein VF638_14200 [Sphingomonas sp.]|jgi:hypothetical protein